jgi:hypothetical protein
VGILLGLGQLAVVAVVRADHLHLVEARGAGGGAGRHGERGGGDRQAGDRDV